MTEHECLYIYKRARAQIFSSTKLPVFLLACAMVAACCGKEPDELSAHQQAIEEGCEVSLSAIPASPQLIGTAIVLVATGACSGGETPEYRWEIDGGSGWQTLQNWSVLTFSLWDTGSWNAGDYQIRVKIRRLGSTVDYEAMASIDHYQLGAAAGTCSAIIAADPPSPQVVGTQITFTANATCTEGGVPEYKWEIWDWQNEVWYYPHEYGPYPTFTWDTSDPQWAAGYFRVLVKVRRLGTSHSYDMVASIDDFHLGAAFGSCSAMALTPTHTSPQEAGTQITFTTTASCDQDVIAEYKYALFGWDGPEGVGWSDLRPWSAEPTYLWNTSQVVPGYYRIVAKVRQLGSTNLDPSEVVSIDAYEITPNVGSPETPQPIAPYGLINEVTPTFTWIASSSATSYRVVSEDGQGQVFDHTISAQTACPSGEQCSLASSDLHHDGTWSWQVHALNAAGNSPWSQRFLFHLGPALGSCSAVALTPTHASPQEAGTQITFTTTASCDQGVIAEYKYALFGWDGPEGVGWNDLRPWSAEPTYLWDTSQVVPGYYRILAKVRPLGSTNPDPSEVVSIDAYEITPQTGSPETPQPLAPYGLISIGTPTFTWQAVSGATSYRVVSDDGQGQVFDHTVSAQAACPSGEQCSLASSDLHHVGSWSWQVNALNGVGYSPWSRRFLFTVVDAGTYAAMGQCQVLDGCDPATGLCALSSKPDGTMCNDGSVWTLKDTCQSGSCQGEELVTHQGLSPHASRASSTPTLSIDGSTYTFLSEDQRVQYAVDVAHPDVQQGMLHVTARVGTQEQVVISHQGGMRYRPLQSTASGSAQATVLDPSELAARSGHSVTLEHNLDDDALVLTIREFPGEHALKKTYRLSLHGVTLRVEFYAESLAGVDGYAGVSLGTPEIPGASPMQLPYLPERILFIPGATPTFLTAYVDRTLSSSSASLDNGPTYSDWINVEQGQEPSVVPISEVAYITLSDQIEEVLPGSPWEPSTQREQLTRRLVFDMGDQEAGFFRVREGVALQWDPPPTVQGSGELQLVSEWAGLGGPCANELDCPGDYQCFEGQCHLCQPDEVGGYLLLLAGTDLVESYPLSVSSTTVTKSNIDLSRRLRFELLAQNSKCDLRKIKLTITDSQGHTYSPDVSGQQGTNGFWFLQISGDRDKEMTYQVDRWVGSGDQYIQACDNCQGALANGLLVRHTTVADPKILRYRSAEIMLRRFAEYGLNNLAVNRHNWQRWGFDHGSPEYFPADPSMGTDEEMKTLIQTAKSKDMLFAFYHQFSSLDKYLSTWDEQSPYLTEDPASDYFVKAFDPDHRVRKASWTNDPSDPAVCPDVFEGTPPFCFYAIRPEKMKDVAAEQCSKIKDGYGQSFSPNASFLDVTPNLPLIYGIDFSRPFPTMARAYAETAQLFDTMRACNDGPVFGEGGWDSQRMDTYFAGKVDAVHRRPEGDQSSSVAADFELSMVRPQMFSYGVGWYVNYFNLHLTEAQTVPPPDWSNCPLEADLDRYRAKEIAFGHAGYLGWVPYYYCPATYPDTQGILAGYSREYWLMRAVQERYGASNTHLASIKYLTASGEEYDLGQAIAAGIDLSAVRMKLVYDNGLVIYLNLDTQDPWLVTRQVGGNLTLPLSGFLAERAEAPAGNFVAYSAISAGTHIDYVNAPATPDVVGLPSSPSYTYAATRGDTLIAIEEIETDGAIAIIEGPYGPDLHG